MNTEIEAKFLNVDFEQVRAKLRELGGVCAQPMRLMRRVLIEPPHLAAKNSFLRVRDEGDKVTLTYKQFDTVSLTGAKEIEVTVNSFDDTIALLAQAGLECKALQESKRETWHLGDVEVVLDEWPWIKPYIEIEGPGEDHVKDTAARLGFEWSNAVFGQVTEVYQAQYPNGQANKLPTIAHVAFGDVVPEIISGEKQSNE